MFLRLNLQCIIKVKRYRGVHEINLYHQIDVIDVQELLLLIAIFLLFTFLFKELISTLYLSVG